MLRVNFISVLMSLYTYILPLFAVCPIGSHGLNCSVSCTCKNGATCNHTNGACTCLPGYVGTDCEKSKCVFNFGVILWYYNKYNMFIVLIPHISVTSMN